MKNTILKVTILIVSLIFIAGCSNSENNVVETKPTEPLQELILCSEEEKTAEICTMDYSPVCGDDNKNYSNACSACSTSPIDGYTTWECK